MPHVENTLTVIEAYLAHISNEPYLAAQATGDELLEQLVTF